MTTAKFTGRGAVMTRIAPRATGHAWAKDGTLLRVHCEGAPALRKAAAEANQAMQVC